MAGGYGADDLAAIREEGSLVALFTQLAGKTLPKQRESEPDDEGPGYHIARPGAWPCGTAASGPTPPACTHQPAPPGTPQPERTTT